MSRYPMDPELEARLNSALVELAAKHDAAFARVLGMISQEEASTPQQQYDRIEALIIFQLCLPPGIEDPLPLTDIVNHIAETQEFRRTAMRVYRDLVRDLRLFHDAGFPGTVNAEKLGLLRKFWHILRGWFSG
jgi:hypothetical protein